MTERRPTSAPPASPLAALGWADLLRARAAGGRDLMDAAAALLGLQATDPGRGEPGAESHKVKDRAPAGASYSDQSAGAAPLVGTQIEPIPTLAYWMLTEVVLVPSAQGSEASLEPADLPRWTTRPAPAQYAPLETWEALLPRLRRALAVPVPTRVPDVPRLLRRIARGDGLTVLPLQTRRRWGPAVQILEDRSRRLTPYWCDQAMVRARLARLFPRHAVTRALIDETLALPPGLCQGGADHGDYRPPPPGGALVVLGDLGALDGTDRTMAFWRALGRRVTDAGARALALVPLAPKGLPQALAAHWTPIGWERGATPLAAGERETQVGQLLDALSVTARVDPGLLRDLRRLLGLDVSSEAAFWQHPALTSPSSVAATLDPLEIKTRRANFDRLPEVMHEAIWGHIRAWRAHQADEVYLGEAAQLSQASAYLLPAKEQDLLERFIDTLSERIRGLGGAQAPEGASAWFLRLERRAHKGEPIWRRPSVHRLWASLHPQGEGEAPPGFDPATVAADPGGKALALDLAQCGPDLCLAPASTADAASGSPMGRVTTLNRWVAVHVPVQAETPPAWVDDWGQDAYGAWASFVVQGQYGWWASQRMRWIEPRSFQMGSPEDEAERLDREGPRHEVRLAEGYWLFDTACTQELWQAVMGENPARFKGARRPVERVSWDQVHGFIDRLNERVPGLDLCLPSEAQWEYACRAGTNTPFSFGLNITPEQVNYDGNGPYAGSAKGRNRGQTVPVGSLPPNTWGLCEMHGNVFEWVEDAWHEGYEGAPTNGSAWESNAAGAARVIRGGSWSSVARDCRSAYRLRNLPVNRFDFLGFRCARVQGPEAGQEGRGSAPGWLTVRPAVAGEGARPATRVRSEGQGGPGMSRHPPSVTPVVPAGMPEPTAMDGQQLASSDLQAPHRPHQVPYPVVLRLDTTAQASVALPDAPSLEVRTDREVMTLRRTPRPDWASAMGRDRFGLWAEIAIEPSSGPAVIQRLRWIPPGRFLMGSPEDEPGRRNVEVLRHPVTVGRGFWLFDAPCTQGLWEAVTGENLSAFQSRERPVEGVSWEDVQKRFLPALNERLPGFILPSEAQWEYACRAGTDTALYNGPIEILGDANAPALDAIAWYGGNSHLGFELDNGRDRGWFKDMQYPGGKAGTRPVKGKRPNPWGLYDMLGNVWEWTADAWHDSYEGASADGRVRDMTDNDAGAARVIRGGSWSDGARDCRSASRYRGQAGGRGDYLGFRCARVQDARAGG